MVKNCIPRYLKKRKLYTLAKSLIKEEIPLCKYFEYSFYQGSEWITGGNYRISSMSCGNWIRIRRSRFDEEKDDFVYDNETYSGFWDGKYHYHSINGKLVEMSIP